MGPVRKNFVISGLSRYALGHSAQGDHRGNRLPQSVSGVAVETSVATAGRVTSVYAVATFRTARVATSLSW